MFFKLLLASGLIIYRVLGNTECDPCNCCKDSSCPNIYNKDCTAGCLNGYTGTTCQNKCPYNCDTCEQYNADKCFQCKSGYYKGWSNGQWIDNCSLTCPNNCVSCSLETTCSSCKDGFYNGLTSDLNNNISYSDCRLSCYSGCKACISYGVCTECKDGYFGRSLTGNYSCQHECSDGCIDNICNKDNGSCDCKSTYWGQNCSEKCRPQCKTCENYDVCNECFHGFYGPFCQYSCSDGCRDIICNKDNGTCDCKSTYWGEKCESTCSKGCNFSECFNDTGKCMAGCETGFTGESCDTCVNGYFDDTCSSICPANCLADKSCSNNCTDIICNRLTGECDNGCKDNFWGRHCEYACSRNCKDVIGPSTCDKSNGNCLARCTDGYFSENCDKKCSLNCFNISCDINGNCLYGCKGEFEDGLCLQVKSESRQGIAGIAATLGGSVGGAVVLVVILIVVAVVILKRRRKTKCHTDKNNLINEAVLYTAEDESLRQTDSDSAVVVYSMPVKKKKEQGQSNTGNPKNQNPSDPKKSEDFATVCEKTVIQDDLNIDPTATSPANLLQEGLTPDPATRLSQEDSTPALATVLPLKDRASQSQKENVLELEDPNEGSTSAALSPENGSGLTKSGVGDTNEALLKRKIKDCFKAEFEKLPSGLIKPYTESQKQDNLRKNRYRGVFPYNYNRVILKDGESDYINASFIDGYKKLKTYIASLGSTYKYMDDISPFWRMVWQEKYGKIVMLTNLLEAEILIKVFTPVMKC